MKEIVEKTKRSISRMIILFMFGLILSGLTALPIEWQLELAHDHIKSLAPGQPLIQWLEFVYQGVHETNLYYPFISYGTDWLAFAHFVIALVFIGPWRNPVRNIWVIEFGIIACLLIFPFAFIAGSLRGIPIFWRLIDCSFGLLGGLLLWHCRNKIQLLETLLNNPV